MLDVTNFGLQQDSAPELASDIDSIFSAVVFPLYTYKHVLNNKINFSIQYLQIFVLQAMRSIILAIKPLLTPERKLVSLLATELEFVNNIHAQAEVSIVTQNRPLLIPVIFSICLMPLCLLKKCGK